jgi:hypothetical protein
MHDYRVTLSDGTRLAVRARGMQRAADLAAAHLYTGQSACAAVSRDYRATARCGHYDVANWRTGDLLGRLLITLRAPDGRRSRAATEGVKSAAPAPDGAPRPVAPYAGEHWWWWKPLQGTPYAVSETEGPPLTVAGRRVYDTLTGRPLARGES